MSRSHSPKAFTLIELLVVIAILAILVAMLCPLLSGAKEVARFTVCKVEMKKCVEAFHGYAYLHDNRFPGGATSSAEHWYVCWPQILNREYFGANDAKYYPPVGSVDSYWDEPTHGPILKFWSFWAYNNTDLRNKYCVCPTYRAWIGPGGKNQWSRPWQTTNYVCGGHYEDLIGPDPTHHPYGGLALPKNRFPSLQYTEYHLGHKQDTFGTPGSKYLVWDSEAYDDYIAEGYDTSGMNGAVVVGDDPSNYPPWTSRQAQLSFRHLLTPDPTVWQSRARASCGYIDGHVDAMDPTKPMFASDRFVPDQ